MVLFLTLQLSVFKFRVAEQIASLRGVGEAFTRTDNNKSLLLKLLRLEAQPGLIDEAFTYLRQAYAIFAELFLGEAILFQ